jgi:hypothetical protein
MSRQVTNKGVDKFVDTLHDHRFAPYLFASHLANETGYIQRQFFEMLTSYLHVLARNHQQGVDYTNTTDLAAHAYRMYNAYLESGGWGEPLPSPDLSRFDIPYSNIV